jgi:hypothetical protein
MDIVGLSRSLMRKQTLKNKAPAWLLTELAIAKGKELAKRQGVEERLVLASLYLSHTIFSPVWGSRTLSNHPILSARFTKKQLDRWGVGDKDKKIILNAIEAHHGKVRAKTKVAEIVKNAECFKFVSVQGSLIWLHELGQRQIPYDLAVERVILKMEEKRKLLTLPECKREAEKNCRVIKKLFG